MNDIEEQLKSLQSLNYDMKLHQEAHEEEAKQFVREIIAHGCTDLVLRRLLNDVIIDTYASRGKIAMLANTLTVIHKLATSGKATKERMRAIADLSKVKEHTGMED